MASRGKTKAAFRCVDVTSGKDTCDAGAFCEIAGTVVGVGTRTSPSDADAKASRCISELAERVQSIRSEMAKLLEMGRSSTFTIRSPPSPVGSANNVAGRGGLDV